MGTGWLLNREEDPLHSGVYQVKGMHGKPHIVRTGEQSTRRLDAGILVEPSLWRLARLWSNILLVFCEFRPLNCKGDE
jgi:hypothetical protein